MLDIQQLLKEQIKNIQEQKQDEKDEEDDLCMEFDIDENVAENKTLLAEIKKSMETQSLVNTAFYEKIKTNNYRMFNLVQTMKMFKAMDDINPLKVKQNVIKFLAQKEEELAILENSMTEYEPTTWSHFNIFLINNIINTKEYKFTQSFFGTFNQNYEHLIKNNTKIEHSAALKNALCALIQLKFYVCLKIIQLVIHIVDQQVIELIMPVIDATLANNEEPNVEEMVRKVVGMCCEAYTLDLPLIVSDEATIKTIKANANVEITKLFVKNVKKQCIDNNNNNT